MGLSGLDTGDSRLAPVVRGCPVECVKDDLHIGASSPCVPGPRISLDVPTLNGLPDRFEAWIVGVDGAIIERPVHGGRGHLIMRIIGSSGHKSDP